MSPKDTSLAYEVLIEESALSYEELRPELSLVIPKRVHSQELHLGRAASQPIAIRGSITVSF